TLIGSGIGIDLVCLSPMPLHSVPLFKYRTPRQMSDLKIDRREQRQAVMETAGREDDQTPRQHQPNFSSMSGTSTVQAAHDLAQDRAVRYLDASDDWRFAMPYWVDVSFW